MIMARVGLASGFYLFVIRSLADSWLGESLSAWQI